MNAYDHEETVAYIAAAACDLEARRWKRSGRMYAAAHDAAAFHYDGTTYSYWLALEISRKAVAAIVAARRAAANA